MTMDIRKIDAGELKIENFAFMNMTAADADEWRGQTMLFDGAVIGLCTKGRFDFRINYREFRLDATEMFLVLPKHLFTALEYSDDVEVKLLLLSTEYLHAMPVAFGVDTLKHAGQAPCIRPPRCKIEDCIALCGLMERYGADDALSRQTRNALMLSFLLILSSVIDCAKADTPHRATRQELLTRRFFDLMLTRYETERNVSYYADKLCVTPKYLSAAVKNTTRRTSQEWINEALLVDARRYLKCTDLTIAQISEKLHFSTASSFVRFFRQHAGMTPLEFRRK